MSMSTFKLSSNGLWCLKSHMCYDLQISKSLLEHIFACYSFYPLSSGYFNSYPKQCELLFFFLSIKNVTQGNAVYKWSYHENLKSWSWPHIRGNSFVISLCPAANPMACHFLKVTLQIVDQDQTAPHRVDPMQAFLMLPAGCQGVLCELPKPVSTVVELISRYTQITIEAFLTIEGASCSEISCP